MKKLMISFALCFAAAPALLGAAPAVQAAEPAGAYLKIERTEVGPFEFESVARDEAQRLRDNGYHAEVFFRDGWRVRAWRYV
ncbi:MAG TPA: hypothetical protein VMS17_28355 [Gemmataceae bacterium]|nr:hypothetical protein [Gemmataceae bacterium]